MTPLEFAGRCALLAVDIRDGDAQRFSMIDAGEIVPYAKGAQQRYQGLPEQEWCADFVGSSP
ncbi:MAG TPA: hypothetical protein VGC09_19450 [Rhodopila sp.]